MTTVARDIRERQVAPWLGALFRTRPAAQSTDVALVAVRIVLAWIFVYYGAGKLFGAFDGPGIHQTAQFMADTAHLHPGGLFAVVGGVVELGGAIAVAFGLGARLAGVALFVDMVIAMIAVTWTNGINSEQVPPGYELNLALAALAFVVALLGAGRFSADALVERRLAAGRRGAE
jgi:putative oxidoreductase